MLDRMLCAGFFRELPHGRRDGPSLIEMKGTMSPALRPSVAAYLRSGTTIVIGGRTDNALVPGEWLWLRILTDGRWVWPSDLIAYVEHHGAAIPSEFAEEMRGRAWVAPPVDRAGRARVLDAMREKRAVYL